MTNEDTTATKKMTKTQRLENAFNPLIEVRTNPDGTIDEVVAQGVSVHLEQMSESSYALIICEPGRTLNLSIESRGRVKAFVFSDEREDSPPKSSG